MKVPNPISSLLPPAASAQSQSIDSLMGMLHVLIAVVFLGWLLYFAIVVFRGLRRRTPQEVGRRSAVAAGVFEVGIAVTEIAILVFVAFPYWSARNRPAGTEKATEIRVVAEQFAWNIHYPGKDGKFGRSDPSLVSPENPLGLDPRDPAGRDDIVTINEMHVPVRKPVHIQLTSKDVIHSFSIPVFRVKQDAVPGQRSDVWFTPVLENESVRAAFVSHYYLDASDSLRDYSLLSPVQDILAATGGVILEKGSSLTAEAIARVLAGGVRTVLASPDQPIEIACAQLCGLAHFRMRAVVTVESDSAFYLWLDQQRAMTSADSTRQTPQEKVTDL